MEFQGSNQVMVGNGKTLHISHVGHGTLPKQHSSLQLRNILHTLHFSNNLLCVSKLCYDNHTFIEFYPQFYIVKD